MPNNSNFTPEQIQEILDIFFDNFAHRQYIGSRYVPIFGRKNEESILWDNTGAYEPLTIVLHEGNSYTSRQFVPIGVDIHNQEFWANTGNYNAQIEQYRQEVQLFDQRITDNKNNIDKYAYPTNNPIYYGADNTGIEESSDAINACVEANLGGIVIFSPGVYRLDNPILLPQAINNRVSIDFNGATLNIELSTEYAIGVGYGDDSEDSLAGVQKTFIRNLNLINETTCPVGIKSKYGYKNMSIENSNILGFENAIVIGDENQTAPSDFQIENCFLRFNDMSVNSNGIVFYTSDNKVNNCRIYGFKNAFYSKGTGNFIDNVHAFPQGNPAAQTLEETSFIYQVSGGANHIRNCYCDTLGAFIRFAATATGHIDFVSNRQLSYRSDFKQTFIDASQVTSRIIGFIAYNNIQMNGTSENETIIMPSSDNLQHVLSDELVIFANKLESSGGFSYSFGDILTLKNKTAQSWHKVIHPTEAQWTRLCAIPVTRNERAITLEIQYPYTRAVIENVSLIVNASNPSDTTKNHISLVNTTAGSNTYRYGMSIDTTTFSYPVVYFYVNRPNGQSISTPVTVRPNIYGVTDVYELADYEITNSEPTFTTTI